MDTLQMKIGDKSVIMITEKNKTYNDNVIYRSSSNQTDFPSGAILYKYRNSFINARPMCIVRVKSIKNRSTSE